MQVHPTDEYAKEHENGQLGKTEMWYVLDAGREASLVYGLNHRCTKEEIRQAIEDGSVMQYLQKVPIHKDDVFLSRRVLSTPLAQVRWWQRYKKTPI